MHRKIIHFKPQIIHCPSFLTKVLLIKGQLHHDPDQNQTNKQQPKLAIMKVHAGKQSGLSERLKGFILLLLICTFCSSINGFAQQSPQKTVTGKVIDANGQPLAGVSIVVKGKSAAGTTTDATGTFSLSNLSPSDALIFSFVGYESEEVKVGKGNLLNINMRTAASNSLNDVVVVGYGSTSRKNLTTAISKVDPKAVPQAANNSIAQLLFGRAAGLQAVQQSAEPGGNIVLSVRGRGDPLIVVDGVVMPYQGLEPGNGVASNPIGGELNGVHRGGFAGLNPQDIESIEILKDASASIYGVNAANGVILITTKKGTAGRMNITYDGSESIVKNLPYFEPLGPSDYMKYYNELSHDQYLVLNKMAPFGPNAATGFTPKYTDAQIQNPGPATDWIGMVLRDGRIDNHNVSVNGGSDKVTYYLSGNYFNQIGTMHNSGLQKYSGKMNISAKLNNFITINAGLNAAKNNFSNSTAGWQNGGSGSQGFGALQAALQYPTIFPVRDSSGNYFLSPLTTTGNPVSLLDIQDQTTYGSLMTNLSVDFSILPKILTGKILYGNNSENATRNFFIPSDVFYFQQLLSRGSYSEASRQYQTIEATLSLKKNLFKDKVNLSAVAGVGKYIYDDYGFVSQGSGMLDEIGTSNLASAAQSSYGISSYKNYTQTRSYFGRASLDFLDKYVLSLSYRYDGYNNFFPQNKYAGFPSVSMAWKLSNEDFLKNVEAINLLKFRASYGITGNLPSPAAVAYGTFSPDASTISFNDGRTNYVAYYLTALDQPGLQWPKTENKNIGLDFSLFKNRISGSLDWFRDDLTRILNTSSITAPLSIITTAPSNGAHQVRQGYELSVNTVNMRSSVFQWSSIINISHLSYTWMERFPNAFVPPGAKVKDPVNAIYAFPTNGILQIGQAVPAAQPSTASLPGSPIFVDGNNDKSIDSGDIRKYDIDPKLLIGFGNTFKYKNWDLLIFLYAQLGGHNYNANAGWQDPANFLAGSAGVKQIKDVWSTSNTAGTLHGIAYNEGALGLLAGSDQGITSTNFLRVRNIALGYKLAPSTYFKSLRVYVDVQNAFIFTKYKIGDPEVQATAVKGAPAPYPMARTFSLGVQASF